MVPLCGGVFPDKVQEDRFTCSDCCRRVEHQLKVLRSFVSRYAGDTTLLRDILAASTPASRGGAVDSGANGGGGFVFGLPAVAPQLSLKEDKPAGLVADYVVAHTFSKMFVECPTADYRSSVDVAVLRHVFPSWAAFFTYMNTQPSRDHDVQLMRPFVDAVLEASGAAQAAAAMPAPSPSASSASSSAAAAASLPRSLTDSVRACAEALQASARSSPHWRKAPFLGEITLRSAAADLERFVSERSLRAKLRALNSLRNTLATALHTATLVTLPHSAPGGVDRPAALAPAQALPFNWLGFNRAAGEPSTASLGAANPAALGLGAAYEPIPASPAAAAAAAAAASAAAISGTASAAAASGSPEGPVPAYSVLGSELRGSDAAGSAEDFMLAVCYVIVAAQPKGLLST